MEYRPQEKEKGGKCGANMKSAEKINGTKRKIKRGAICKERGKLQRQKE
jgi:hypothetical protein